MGNHHPVERSLVKKFENLDFAIVGVFGVSDEKEMRRLLKSEEVTWPCLYWMPDDRPPALEWGVRDWPANFVIDRGGVVRAVNVFEEQKLTSVIKDLIDQPKPSMVAVSSE